MTAITHSAVRRRPATSASFVAGAGCVALLTRPALAAVPADPTAVLVLLFAALLVVGAAWPLMVRTDAPPAGHTRLVVTAAGVGAAAFVAGRLVAGSHSAGPLTLRFVALNAFAAVAEEAFFRRFVFGILEDRFGAVGAVLGSAAAFAAVHVTAYGAWVLPIDLAAGLVFAWQRRVTGSWGVPAATHVLANILAVL